MANKSCRIDEIFASTREDEDELVDAHVLEEEAAEVQRELEDRAYEDQVVGSETVLELAKGDPRFGQHTMLRALRFRQIIKNAEIIPKSVTMRLLTYTDSSIYMQNDSVLDIADAAEELHKAKKSQSMIVPCENGDYVDVKRSITKKRQLTEAERDGLGIGSTNPVPCGCVVCKKREENAIAIEATFTKTVGNRSGKKRG
ncbi:uncharacterized protein RAG0_03358 [Rhynchosporium agropyri]|uniref:Uncharacterized protein n=1 Tax=Rhynchosporium agropyri TaxID=914238 RepID=A0A1E1K429_9HELO|nr:uncharacterized protein RAG0_03358 [Rhynchosporium agropyri]